jgi:zinc transport system ATP-binding protein
MFDNNFTSDIAVFFKGVTVKLNGSLILDNIRASIPRGGCTAIVGPNGAGKTTLLLALLGQTTFKGEIYFTGFDKTHSPRIGYVPQRMLFDRGIPVTVTEFLSMGVQRSPLRDCFNLLKQNTLKSANLELFQVVKCNEFY